MASMLFSRRGGRRGSADGNGRVDDRRGDGSADGSDPTRRRVTNSPPTEEHLKTLATVESGREKEAKEAKEKMVQLAPGREARAAHPYLTQHEVAMMDRLASEERSSINDKAADRGSADDVPGSPFFVTPRKEEVMDDTAGPSAKVQETPAGYTARLEDEPPEERTEEVEAEQFLTPLRRKADPPVGFAEQIFQGAPAGPSSQLSMPKPLRSRRHVQASSSSCDGTIARAPPALVSPHKPGQQQLLPPKQSSSASQVQALQEVHWLMNNGSEEERRSALRTLAALSSAENLPAGLLADTIRTAKDCVEFLCSMLMDTTLVEAALVALGNFGIEANDDDMLRVGTCTYTAHTYACA